MQNGRLKRYRMLVQRFDGLLTRTPVITYGLAIPFAVMGTVDTRAAFTLSVGMMVISLLSTVVGWLLKRMGQGREVCMLVTAILSSLTLSGLSRIPLEGFHLPVGTLGIYFPLLAVNTLTFFLVTRCDGGGTAAEKSGTVSPLCSFLCVLCADSFNIPGAAWQGDHFSGIKVLNSPQITTVLMPFFRVYPGGDALCIFPSGEPDSSCLVPDS